MAHLAQLYIITSPALTVQPELCPTNEVVEPWIAAEVDAWEGNHQWIYFCIFQLRPSGCSPRYCTGFFLKISITALCSPHKLFTPSIITTWICAAITGCRERGREVLLMQTISADVFMATSCICFTEILCCSKLCPSYYLSFSATRLDTLVCSWHTQRPSTFHKHEEPNHWLWWVWVSSG